MTRRLAVFAAAIFALLMSSLPAQAVPAIHFPSLPPEIAYAASSPAVG